MVWPGEAFGFRHRSRQTSLCASSWRGRLLSPQLSGEWFSAATNGALDLFPRLAVPPFLVWSEAPLRRLRRPKKQILKTSEFQTANRQ